MKISGRKIVGTAFKGDVLLDKYDLSGIALVKVKTSKGDFNSKIDLKVTADECPF